ncbi:MAG: formylglycine-generating enzyme family protein [Candidatus Methylumidiphilus sp.]
MNLAERLTDLLKTHGPALLRDRARLLGLAAAWPEAERNLLAVAFQAGVTGRLLARCDEANQRQSYQILTEEHALAPAAAEQAIRALSMALGQPLPPRLAPPVATKPFALSLPPLAIARGGRILARLALAAVLMAVLGFVMGWLLQTAADTPAAQALQTAKEQQAALQAQIAEAKTAAEARRQALQAELAALKNPAATKGDSKPPPGQISKDCPDCPAMVAIPAGEFMMGSDVGDAQAQPEEKPRHLVQVKAFKLGQYEVTQAQWQAVMGSNPSHISRCGGDCPVVFVSFGDMRAYIAKLNQQTGQHYRLPTEAEWEYACRAGGTGRYCGSDDPDAVAWHAGNADSMHPVGQKQKNAFGLYDMSGNVWELTCSAYTERYDGSEKTCAKEADSRAVRGGSWNNKPRDLRPAGRFGGNPKGRGFNFGFRLAQD